MFSAKTSVKKKKKETEEKDTTVNLNDWLKYELI